MTINPITVYYCPGCTAAYATAAEALVCGGGETRQPEPEPHVVWPCRREDCEVWLHDSEEDARKCAKEGEQK